MKHHTKKTQNKTDFSHESTSTTIKSADIVKATQITLKQYSETFKDLARHDRRERVSN